MSNYQKRVLSELLIRFGRESFTAWDLADMLESPYGNTCSTIRGLLRAGNLVNVTLGEYSINPNIAIKESK